MPDQPIQPASPLPPRGAVGVRVPVRQARPARTQPRPGGPRPARIWGPRAAPHLGRAPPAALARRPGVGLLGGHGGAGQYRAVSAVLLERAADQLGPRRRAERYDAACHPAPRPRLRRWSSNAGPGAWARARPRWRDAPRGALAQRVTSGLSRWG